MALPWAEAALAPVTPPPAGVAPPGAGASPSAAVVQQALRAPPSAAAARQHTPPVTPGQLAAAMRLLLRAPAAAPPAAAAAADQSGGQLQRLMPMLGPAPHRADAHAPDAASTSFRFDKAAGVDGDPTAWHPTPRIGGAGAAARQKPRVPPGFEAVAAARAVAAAAAAPATGLAAGAVQDSPAEAVQATCLRLGRTLRRARPECKTRPCGADAGASFQQAAQQWAHELQDLQRDMDSVWERVRKQMAAGQAAAGQEDALARKARGLALAAQQERARNGIKWNWVGVAPAVHEEPARAAAYVAGAVPAVGPPVHATGAAPKHEAGAPAATAAAPGSGEAAAAAAAATPQIPAGPASGGCVCSQCPGCVAMMRVVHAGLAGRLVQYVQQQAAQLPCSHGADGTSDHGSWWASNPTSPERGAGQPDAAAIPANHLPGDACGAAVTGAGAGGQRSPKQPEQHEGGTGCTRNAAAAAPAAAAAARPPVHGLPGAAVVVAKPGAGDVAAAPAAAVPGKPKRRRRGNKGRAPRQQPFTPFTPGAACSTGGLHP